jgi:hypothetical protein
MAVAQQGRVRLASRLWGEAWGRAVGTDGICSGRSRTSGRRLRLVGEWNRAGWSPTRPGDSSSGAIEADVELVTGAFLVAVRVPPFALAHVNVESAE